MGWLHTYTVVVVVVNLKSMVQAKCGLSDCTKEEATMTGFELAQGSHQMAEHLLVLRVLIPYHPLPPLGMGGWCAPTTAAWEATGKLLSCG